MGFTDWIPTLPLEDRMVVSSTYSRFEITRQAWLIRKIRIVATTKMCKAGLTFRWTRWICDCLTEAECEDLIRQCQINYLAISCFAIVTRHEGVLQGGVEIFGG